LSGGGDPNIWKFLDILKKHQAVQQVAMNQNMENLEISQETAIIRYGIQIKIHRLFQIILSFYRSCLIDIQKI
jgi:hypothetical protein